MSQTEERLFTLMTHAEDLQRVAQSSLQEVGKAIQRMETGTGNAILSVIRTGIDETMQETKTGLTEAAMGLKKVSEEAKGTREHLRRTGLILGVFLVTMAFVVGSVGFAIMNTISKTQLAEMDKIKAAILAEQSTLDELQSKTWGIKLTQYEDGTRSIIMPKGTKIDRIATTNDGRSAAVIKP